MRATSPRISATATAAAALLVLLFASTRPTPTWPDSNGFGARSDGITESFGTPDRHVTNTGISPVWMVTTATPPIVTNASFNCSSLSDDLEYCALSSLGGHTILPDFQTAGVCKVARHPNRRTTTTTTTTRISRRYMRRSTSTTSIRVTKDDISAAATSCTIIFHGSFDGRAHDQTGNESRWRRYRHEPLPLPDEFMARFLNTVMYLAEVITADVISAFLFGRWRPRFYQRAKKNRLDRERRRCYRRLLMYTADVGMIVRDAFVRLHDALCPIHNGVATPTYQKVSNVQLAEYPATLSAFSDVPTSEVVAALASASRSALVSIPSLSAPTSEFPGLPLLTSNGAQVETPTVELRPGVPTFVPRVLGSAGMSNDAPCYQSASLPDTAIAISLRSAIHHRPPLLLEAAPLTTGPLLSPTIRLPEGGHEEVTFRAQRLLGSMCPSSTAAIDGCAVSNAIIPTSEDSNTEREWLAVLGVKLLLEGLDSPSSPTSPWTRKHHSTIVASEANSGNAEGIENPTVRYATADQSVTMPVEEFRGQADDADDTAPAPFFASEHYTPESTCYVSLHGVAYTTIIMSYFHRVNLSNSLGTQVDTPTTTQAGDVSDILFPAVNARMRSKWSRECIQTVSSECYRSSVEAVFVARLIPDATDMVVLSDLVTRHL